jgi:HlyD family secretion protein
MKSRAILFLIAFGLGLSAFLILRTAPLPVETAFPTRGPVTETLRSDGYFRSRDRRTVTAFASGEIGEILLKVGDRVEKNQELTRLNWDVKPEAVRSPLRGVVSKVFRETAGPIQRGEPLLEIVDPFRLEVVAEILTLDAARVKPGQKARISGFGGEQVLPARVSRISRAGFVKMSALGVEEERTEVILLPEKTQAEFETGSGNLFHAEVEIETAFVEAALRVPLGALVVAEGMLSVYVIEAGQARIRKVVRGIDDGYRTVIRDGLSEQDRIILYPGERIRDGIRVKLASPDNPG